MVFHHLLSESFLPSFVFFCSLNALLIQLDHGVPETSPALLLTQLVDFIELLFFQQLLFFLLPEGIKVFVVASLWVYLEHVGSLKGLHSFSVVLFFSFELSDSVLEFVDLHFTVLLGSEGVEELCTWDFSAGLGRELTALGCYVGNAIAFYLEN